MKIKKEIHNIHDKSYKDLFSNKELLVDMIQSFIKSSWGKEITKDNIELVNKSYILSDYEELESDIVYKATIENKEVIFYILLEFQSYVDYSMPIRLFLYMSEIWREVLKNTKQTEVKSKEFKLPAIVPLVLYNGEYKWTVEKKFKNVINKSELFGNNIIDFEYILIDINKYEKEELMQLGNIASAVFLLDQKVDIEEFISRVKDIAISFNNLSEEQKMMLRHWLRITLSDEIKDKLGEKIEDILIAKKEEVVVMTSNISKTIKETFEKTREEGIERGIEKGIERGIERGIEKVAVNMIRKGKNIEEIMEVTELSYEKIIELKEKIS
jgi:predicted transposase/invertase (TIGR01784 family)